MNNKIYKYIRYGVGIIFPPRCVVCDEVLDEPGDMIHKKCLTKLYPVDEKCCMHCGRQLVLSRQECCPECENKIKKRVLTFKQGKSLWQYRGAIKQSMYRFKYSNRREYADYYASEAAKRYGDWIKRNNIQAIVPIPMYEKKKRLRGYNQASVFAKALGRELSLPVDEKMIKRIANTRPMKELNDKERKKNLQNAFQIDSNIVQYSYILLVDDIYTTGSTADAVAEVIFQVGIKGIYFLSICTGQEY